MGGRIAEELIFGHEELTTGCSQDLTQATKIASELVRNMGYTVNRSIGLSGESDKMSDATNELTDKQVETLMRVEYIF